MKPRLALLAVVLWAALPAAAWGFALHVDYTDGTATGSTTLEVEPSDTVEAVRHKIQDKVGLQPSEQTLRHQGTVLDPGSSLADYGITSETTIDLVMSERLITVAVQGAGGRVTGPGIDCPGDCTQGYSRNAEVTLTAVPADGWRFDGFADGCVAASTSCAFTVDTAATVTASFSQIPASEPPPPAPAAEEPAPPEAEPPAPTATPEVVPLTLDGLLLRPGVVSRRRPSVLGFVLSREADVAVVIRKLRAGGRAAPAIRVLVRRGLASGAQAVSFRRRIRGWTLAPGCWRLAAIARDASGATARRSLTFAVPRRHGRPPDCAAADVRA